jgi:methanethiol S-methyltransferase
MKRFIILAYGVFSYAVFFATFLYALGFVGNILVPKSIDSAPTLPFASALLVNLGLLAIFALQHSVMARPAFKRWLVRLIPAAAERSTYTLASSLALIVLFWFWQPMGGVIWDIESPLGQALMIALFLFGWGLVLTSTCLINHFDLFGLRQVWLAFRQRPYTPLEFGMPGPYRLVRHPLYVSWLFAFWCTPIMTVAHLVFALATTAYILIAIQLEERDLMDAHPEYQDYRRQVPMLVPSFSKRPGLVAQVQQESAEETI